MDPRLVAAGIVVGLMYFSPRAANSRLSRLLPNVRFSCRTRMLRLRRCVYVLAANFGVGPLYTHQLRQSASEGAMDMRVEFYKGAEGTL